MQTDYRKVSSVRLSVTSRYNVKIAKRIFTARYVIILTSQNSKLTRKLCYRKDDRAMRAISVDREPLRRYTTGCGDMAIQIFPRWLRPPSWICSNRK